MLRGPAFQLKTAPLDQPKAGRARESSATHPPQHAADCFHKEGNVIDGVQLARRARRLVPRVWRGRGGRGRLQGARPAALRRCGGGAPAPRAAAAARQSPRHRTPQAALAALGRRLKRQSGRRASGSPTPAAPSPVEARLHLVVAPPHHDGRVPPEARRLLLHLGPHVCEEGGIPGVGRARKRWRWGRAVSASGAELRARVV